MQKMSQEISIGTVPTVSVDNFNRAIDILVGGNLTDDEKKFVERACRNNWTLRVIVDELREKRGMVEMPSDFDWRSV